MFRFGTRSIDNLKGVHPSLIGLAYRALSLSPYDFGITEGLRTLERQERLLAEGKSTTLHSRHLKGEAIDFAVYVDGKITWEMPYYQQVAQAFKQAAAEYGLKITWGGSWTTLKDGPHIQIEGAL